MPAYHENTIAREPTSPVMLQGRSRQQAEDSRNDLKNRDIPIEDTVITTVDIQTVTLASKCGELNRVANFELMNLLVLLLSRKVVCTRLTYPLTPTVTTLLL